MLEYLEKTYEYISFVIFEYDFDGNVREMFVKEHKELPDDIKREILNMKSLFHIFVIENIDRERNYITLRAIFSDDRYNAWIPEIPKELKIGDLIATRIIFWRSHPFIWGLVHVLGPEHQQLLLAREKFLRELREDIKSFLSIEKSRLSSRTFKRREECLWMFFNFVLENPRINSCQKFNKTMVKSFIRWLKRFIYVSQRFIADSIRSLRKFFDYLVNQGKLNNNPAKDIVIV